MTKAVHTLQAASLSSACTSLVMPLIETLSAWGSGEVMLQGGDALLEREEQRRSWLRKQAAALYHEAEAAAKAEMAASVAGAAVAAAVAGGGDCGNDASACLPGSGAVLGGRGVEGWALREIGRALANPKCVGEEMCWGSGHALHETGPAGPREGDAGAGGGTTGGTGGGDGQGGGGSNVGGDEAGRISSADGARILRGCSAAFPVCQLLLQWRRSDAAVRALRAALAPPLQTGALFGDGTDSATAAAGEPPPPPSAASVSNHTLQLDLAPCGTTGLLRPARAEHRSLLVHLAPAAASFAPAPPPTNPSCALPPVEPLPHLIRASVASPPGCALLSVELPLLDLRLLAHLSGETRLLRACSALAPAAVLSGVETHWRSPPGGGDDTSARLSLQSELWSELFDGALLPELPTAASPAASPATARYTLLSSSAARPDRAQPARPALADLYAAAAPARDDLALGLLSAFPAVASYHAQLVRTARAGSGRLKTLGGRLIRAGRHLNRPEVLGCGLARGAAAASLLGEVCRAASSDVTTTFTNALCSRLGAAAAEGGGDKQEGGGSAGQSGLSGRLSLLHQSRGHLLLVLRPPAGGGEPPCDGAVAAADAARLVAAARETALEVQGALELSVPLHAVVRVGARLDSLHELVGHSS